MDRGGRGRKGGRAPKSHPPSKARARGRRPSCSRPLHSKQAPVYPLIFPLDRQRVCVEFSVHVSRS